MARGTGCRPTRWMIVAAAVLVESIGELGYIFSVYSGTLKTEFRLSQSEVRAARCSVPCYLPLAAAWP